MAIKLKIVAKLFYKYANDEWNPRYFEPEPEIEKIEDLDILKAMTLGKIDYILKGLQVRSFPPLAIHEIRDKRVGVEYAKTKEEINLYYKMIEYIINNPNLWKTDISARLVDWSEIKQTL